jgi:predicted nucleic acid-binding Zn ribbon protein
MRYVKSITEKNHRARKCPSCRAAFPPAKPDQVYCSARCRQAAYRKRKQAAALPHTRETPPLLILPCKQCGGNFWAQRARACFCSTSCRTLYHRALKAAIPAALSSLFRLPYEKAIDLVETQPIGKLRRVLEGAGCVYDHETRRWVQANNPAAGLPAAVVSE